MDNDTAQFIQTLIPFVSVDEILDEYYRIWLMPNEYLISDYEALQRTIPASPLLPAILRGDCPPIVRNLRTDRAYIEWEKKNGLKIEVLEWALNHRGAFPRKVFRRS